MATSSYPFPSYFWQYQGFDYAGIPIDQSVADAMYADGVRVVGRYLYPTHYPNGKGISAQEAQYYINAGIKIFLYYEINSNDALGGYSRGYANGINCYNEAVSVGVPAGTQIYCCCDTGVTDAQASGVVMDYLEGFRDAMTGYSVGIYGGLNVMSACYAAFPDLYRVQAGAWGADEFSPINIRQWLLNKNNSAMQDGYIGISNVTIDSNGYAYWNGYNVDLISTDSDVNLWGDSSPTPPTPPPPPPVPPASTGSKMPIWFYLKNPL